MERRRDAGAGRPRAREVSARDGRRREAGGASARVRLLVRLRRFRDLEVGERRGRRVQLGLKLGDQQRLLLEQSEQALAHRAPFKMYFPRDFDCCMGHGAMEAAERIAADARQRLAGDDILCDDRGVVTAQLIVASWEQGAAAATVGAPYANRLALRMRLIDLSLTLAHSKGPLEVVRAAAHLLAMLKLASAVRAELPVLAVANGGREFQPSTILTNVISTLMGASGRAGASVAPLGPEGNKIAAANRVSAYLLLASLASDLRLELQPSIDAVLAADAEAERALRTEEEKAARALEARLEAAKRRAMRRDSNALGRSRSWDDSRGELE
jgi:hypothetical protein